jgi:hypothetical protein
MRIAAIVLIVAGVLALAYGGFSYRSKDTVVKAGPIELKAEKEHYVNVPIWAGVGALLVGGLLFVSLARR